MRVLWISALVCACACGGGGGGGEPACEGLVAAAPAPEFADVVGSIVVIDGQALIDGQGGLERTPRVTASAAFVDRPIPGFAIPFGVFVGYQTPTMSDGDCRLLEFRPASCDPACANGDVCVEPGTCVPALVGQDLGDVTIGGGPEPIVLSFDEFSGYRAAASATPGWLADCDAITAGATGVSLAASGVAPFDDDVVPASLLIEDDRDLRLTWDPGGAHGRVRLRLLSPNRGHGSPVAAILECDVPDRGELVVPRALIAAMPPSHDEYCAGFDCPVSRLLRYHRGTVATADGTVELVVASGLELRVVHNPELVPD